MPVPDPETERAALLERIHAAFATLSERSGADTMPAHVKDNLATLPLSHLQHLAAQLEAQIAAPPEQPTSSEEGS